MYLSPVRALRLRAAALVLSAFAAVLGPLNAHAANQPPTISGTPPTWVYVGSPYSFKANGFDPEGATLRYTILNKPAWASFDTATGRLTGTPTAVGYWTNIRISVSDGVSSSPAILFSIRAISRNNVAPTISGTPPTSVAVGSAYSFTPTASDANGDPLRFKIVNRPSWATFSSLTGRLSGTPTAASVGTYANIGISVTDGAKSAALAPFSITVSSSTNRAPTISGTPPTSVTAGNAYSFTPTASDADGNALTFSISNKPAWAAFSTTTGKLSGTPSSAQTGTSSNIIIKVTDSKGASASLPAFSITVSSGSTSSGSATLSWTPPTENTNGTTLTNLAGYRIYYGTSSGAMTQRITVANPGTARYVVDGLAAGTWYFNVRAYTTAGVESASSNSATKTVP